MTTKTIVRDDVLREEAERREFELRRERAEMPHKIASANVRVQNLRGDGHRDGDPELEEALQAVRELIARRDALPELIIEAVATRCKLEAAALAEQERELHRAGQVLQREAAKAYKAAQRARRKASEARTLVEANENQRDRLRREAMPLRAFVEQADRLTGDKRLALLQRAREDGLLKPLRGEDSTR